MKHPSKPALRLLAYCRVSTDRQERNGTSLSDQEDRLRGFARGLGAELVGVLKETASGRLPPERRPLLARALAEVRAGQIDGLLVLRLDRLSRRLRHAIDLLDESSRKGWRLIAAEQNLDTATPMGRFVVNLMANLAQLEAEQISERIRDGLAKIARDGRPRSRRTPYGWRTSTGGTESHGDKKPMHRHAAEQRTLGKMLGWRKRGLGPLRIANRLNGAQVPTRTGRPWSVSAVRSILRTATRRAAIGA